MKIVLFSDIHANLPAFSKAIELIDEQAPDAVYCLGDLVGYNVWPNEIIREIRRRRIATIAGNHDAKVKKLTAAQLAEPGKNYAYSLIGDDEKKYLSALPAHIRVEYQLNNDQLAMLLVHGSPSSNDEYLLEDKDENAFLDVFRKAEADILCFGHSHKPYHRILKDEADGLIRYRHAINIGSVGKPKDGTPKGCFVVLKIQEDSNNQDAETIQVDFVRFDYDVEKAAKAVEDSPLSNEFADMLRKGY
jgi:putative phosphoesterase